MSEESSTAEEMCYTFGELNTGEIFDFMGEPYKKISSIRAINLVRNFEWLFKSDTEINQ